MSAGESYLSPSIAKLFVEDYRRSGLTEDRSEPYEELTDRERETLKLVVEGYKTRQIAEILSVTTKTVEAHRASLMKKLGMHSSIELVKYALRRGIISV